ncbi:MAG: hypothetical protein HYZ27_07935, partial [Deltaproteobacteria bacterium]|nr:hypothetical protein [Deltaproteobacteria bacterium]
NVEISYADPSAQDWVVAEQAAASVTVYVRGDPPIRSCWSCSQETLLGRPLLVAARPFSGGGQVIFTTFHYHAQPPEKMLDVLRYLVFQL